ncbi:hypothetical protein F5146DRAFT_1005357 [Armillaria mellea]|nr:hypothetical protein F5146DRAFT_1005357 [Armillaria mellea]
MELSQYGWPWYGPSKFGKNSLPALATLAVSLLHLEKPGEVVEQGLRTEDHFQQAEVQNLSNDGVLHSPHKIGKEVKSIDKTVQNAVTFVFDRKIASHALLRETLAREAAHNLQQPDGCTCSTEYRVFSRSADNLVNAEYNTMQLSVTNKEWPVQDTSMPCARHIPTNLGLGRQDFEESKNVEDKRCMLKAMMVDICLTRNDVVVKDVHRPWGYTHPHISELESRRFVMRLLKVAKKALGDGDKRLAGFCRKSIVSMREIIQ